MDRRKSRKQRSHRQILDAAARLMRRRGVSGAGVDAIMAEAGLTHGGFYAHFPSKSALAGAAAARALAETRQRWFSGLERLSAPARLNSLVSRYLSEAHVGDVEQGCPLPALGADLAREQAAAREAVEAELVKSLDALAAALPEGDGARARDQAAGVLAAAAGGVLLARMVSDEGLRARILRGSRRLILRGLVHDRQSPEPTD